MCVFLYFYIEVNLYLENIPYLNNKYIRAFSIFVLLMIFRIKTDGMRPQERKPIRKGVVLVDKT